eukprot:SAG31_NODE_7199_length_1758_cov_44.919228_1_plen_72_part_00
MLVLSAILAQAVSEAAEAGSGVAASCLVMNNTGIMRHDILNESDRLIVRGVTFSFLWDFSRFHGTDREIRD